MATRSADAFLISQRLRRRELRCLFIQEPTPEAATTACAVPSYS